MNSRLVSPARLYAVRLGRAGVRRAYARGEDQVGIVAPQRTNKTGILADRIYGHPGACVAVSTRDDLFRLTSGKRAMQGPVMVFNPEGVGGVPSTFRPDIVADCADPEIAIRTASAPAARGLGVLVALNDEIQSAREVTKTSTYRLQTFHTPDFGVLGHIDGDGVQIYRRPSRRHAPDTEFEVAGRGELQLAVLVELDFGVLAVSGITCRRFGRSSLTEKLPSGRSLSGSPCRATCASACVVPWITISASTWNRRL